MFCIADAKAIGVNKATSELRAEQSTSIVPPLVTAKDPDNCFSFASNADVKDQVLIWKYKG